MKIDVSNALLRADEFAERATALNELASNIDPALAEIARLADISASFAADPSMHEILDPIMAQVADQLRMHANVFDGGTGEDAIYHRIKDERSAALTARAAPETDVPEQA